MILSCPNCSTRFLVDPAALGSAGRTVRCGACGHEWRQESGKPAVRTFAAPDPDAGDAGKAGDAGEAGDAGKEKQDIAAGPEDRGQLPPARRVPAARPRTRRPGRLFSLVLLAVIAVVLLGSYQFRSIIVSRWPETARHYESLGIPVTPYRNFREALPKD